MLWLFTMYGRFLNGMMRAHMIWLYWRDPPRWFEEQYGVDPVLAKQLLEGDWNGRRAK